MTNVITPPQRLSRFDPATRPPRIVGDWKSPPRRPADELRDQSHGRRHGVPLLMTKDDWTPSPYGWVPVLNEVDQAIQIDRFDYGPIFTLAFWYRPTDNAGTFFQYIYSHGAFAAQPSLNVFLTEDGAAPANRLRTILRDSTDPTVTLDAGVEFTVGWHHYCCTVGGSGVNVYVDGLFRVGNAALGGDAFFPATDIFLGRRSVTPANRWFGGNIADFIIVNQEFSPAQVSRLFLRRRRRSVVTSNRRRKVQTRFQGVTRMPLDLSGDFAVIDGKVNITLNAAVINDVVMLQSKLKEGDPTQGGYLHRETTFQLPTTGDISPKVGDTVAVADVTYNVLKVREPFLGDYWGLTTRELSITADSELQNLITLWPAVNVTDAGGFKRTTHPAASADFLEVAAKIQLQPSKGEEESGKRGFKRTYAIYVSADVPSLKVDDLLKDESSKQYNVESWKNRNRIDEFSVIICNTGVGE